MGDKEEEGENLTCVSGRVSVSKREEEGENTGELEMANEHDITVIVFVFVVGRNQSCRKIGNFERYDFFVALLKERLYIYSDSPCFQTDFWVIFRLL